MTAVDVDVGREGPEVAQRRDLAGDVVGRGRHDQAEQGQTFDLVQPAGDAEVEQRHASVGLDEEVPAVEVAVEDARGGGPLRRRR